MKSKKRLEDRVFVWLLALSVMTDEPQKAYLLIEFVNSHNEERCRMLVAASEADDRRTLRKKLLDAGLRRGLSKECWEKIYEELQKTPTARVSLCWRPGYVDVNGHLCYLTASNQLIGDAGDFAPIAYPKATAFTYDEKQQGSLEDWKIQVASKAAYSPYTMLALCSAFSGFCIYFTDIETGGFHFYAPSSNGKSTALLMAASVYGDKGFVKKWNMTQAGFEEAAEARNHGLLILDELKLLHKNIKEAAELAQNYVYILGSGEGKQRSSSFQPRLMSWHSVMLSSGEFGLGQHAMEGNISRLDGEKVRVVDVPVEHGSGYGIFASLPEGFSSSAFAENIQASCGRLYGIAGPEFVRKLLKKTPDDIRQSLSELINNFLAHNNVGGNNGVVKRIALRFALAYASGVIASKIKILPFNEVEIMDAISHCFGLAVNMDGPKRKVFKPEFIGELECNIYHLFEGDKKIKAVEEMPVIATSVNGIEVVAISSEFFLKNIIGDKKSVFALLCKHDLLIRDGGNKNTRPINYKKIMLKRRYVLNRKRLEDFLDI